MTAKVSLAEDEITEITKARIPRVDLVSKAANGTEFLLMKSVGSPSLFTAEDVRNLAKQAQEGVMTATDIAPDGELAKADEGILEDAPATAEGDPDEPGSPAWEAVDAATAWTLLSQLNQVKRALAVLADRESVEAFHGDEDGYDNSWDLSTACEQVECAIAIVAPYAVGEQDESEQPIEKAVDRSNARGVLADFVKAGRALSAANEQALRAAAASIQNVLASLPPADGDVKKAADHSVTFNISPVVDPDALAKAKEDIADLVKAKPQVLVYDADGNVLGSVDAADLTTFAPAEKAPEKAPEETPETSADAPAEAPAETVADAPADADKPAAEAPADVAPDAAPEAAVIPGTDTVQAPVETDGTDVKKAISTELAAMFKEAFAPLAEQFAAHDDLAEMVKGLQERVEQYGRQPDDRRSPLLNGATGEPGMASRDGQDELAALRKAAEDAPATKKVQAQSALAFAAIKDRFRS